MHEFDKRKFLLTILDDDQTMSVTHRRTEPVRWGGGGGVTHIFGMFCPIRRMHARIRASPENLAEPGGGGGGGGGDSCTFLGPNFAWFLP